LTYFWPLQPAQENEKGSLEQHPYHNEEVPKKESGSDKHLERPDLESHKQMLPPHPSTPI